MESSQFTERKAELELKIKRLEEEKMTLIAEINLLEDKLTTLELESKAKKLEEELQALKDQKITLEQKIAEHLQQQVSEPLAAIAQ